MRRLAVTIAIVLLVLAFVTGPSSKPAVSQPPSADQPAAAQGRGEPKGMQEAEVILMIAGNPLTLRERVDTDVVWARPTADNAIPWLIRSWSRRTGEPGEFRDWKLDFTHLSRSPEGDTVGILTVGGRGDLAKVLATAQRNLQEALVEIHRQSLEPLTRKMVLAEQRVRRAEQRIDQVTAELDQLRQEAIQSGEALQPQDPQVSSAVKRDHLALRAELAGLLAQREAIVEQIAKAKDKLDTAQKEQRLVLDELARVVKLQQDELARARQLAATGVASASEVSKVEISLAQARADLVNHRRLLVQEAGGEQLGRLNERLVDTQIAMTTAEARLKETEKTLLELEKSAYSPVNPSVLKYQRAQRALQNAWAEQEAAAADLAKLQMARDTVPEPRVMVIGGEAKPK
jgi:hypothetical protein